MIHVVATAETLAAQSEIPAVLPGYGAIPAETVRDLAASARARVRSVIDPTKLGAEPGTDPRRR